MGHKIDLADVSPASPRKKTAKKAVKKTAKKAVKKTARKAARKAPAAKKADLAAAVIPPASAEQVATPQLAVTPIAAPAIPAGTSVLNIALPATQTAG
jgi:hypothetical protein